MNNPIVDNRIVSDFTFAKRFNMFLKDIQVNDPMSEEELEYMRNVAKKLFDYQVKTATDKFEIDYLKRVKDLKMKVYIENQLILVKWKHVNNQQTDKSLPSYTECIIEGNIKGYLPSKGIARVSEKDNYNKSIGRKLSMTKALRNAGFDKKTRTIFWDFYKIEFSDKKNV